MQASVECACSAKAETRLSFICNSTPQSMTSLRLPTSDVIGCDVELHQGFQGIPLLEGAKAKMFVHPLWKMFTVGYSSWVRKCLLLVNRDRFSFCKYCTTLWRDLHSLNVMNWVKVRLLPSKPCLFSSNISLNSWWIKLHQLLTASTNRILRRKALNIIIPPPPSPSFVVILYCFYLLDGFNLFVLLPMYAFVSIVVTIIRLSNKNDVIVQIGYFTVFWKENIHGNKYIN